MEHYKEYYSLPKDIESYQGDHNEMMLNIFSSIFSPDEFIINKIEFDTKHNTILVHLYKFKPPCFNFDAELSAEEIFSDDDVGRLREYFRNIYRSELPKECHNYVWFMEHIEFVRSGVVPIKT